LIPFIDISAQYEVLQDKIEAAVLRVLRSGQYIMGPEVDSFEDSLASTVGVKHAISCASGTDALVIALMAKGVGPGDVIFTTPFTFVATAEAIALVGATPVFVDVDAATFNMDVGALKSAIERLTQDGGGGLTARGVVAVDLFGLPADYSAINRIAAEHELFVIEDAAQSVGASSGNRSAGALADIGCTSFFPAKPLGGCGDGGALFTDDDDLAKLFRSIRVHGQGDDKYENVRLGLTGRLDAIQAAILSVKLDILSEEIEKRNRIADRYCQHIGTHRIPLELPSIPEGRISAWAQYSVLAEDFNARQSFRDRLAAAGIPTAVYYPKPLHLQKAFEYLGHSTGDYPISENLSERIFSLPMHPYLSDQQIDVIVEAMTG
jgi:UDP-2-acetamido-2-deoxy-ribo-hexuluronate aminotransferase